MRDLGEKAKNILEEKGHNLDRSSLQVHIFLHMPSPSASSKFGLSILNFYKHAQFFKYIQNHFGILKS